MIIFLSFFSLLRRSHLVRKDVSASSLITAAANRKWERNKETKKVSQSVILLTAHSFLSSEQVSFVLWELVRLPSLVSLRGRDERRLQLLQRARETKPDYSQLPHVLSNLHFFKLLQSFLRNSFFLLFFLSLSFSSWKFFACFSISHTYPLLLSKLSRTETRLFHFSLVRRSFQARDA